MFAVRVSLLIVVGGLFDSGQAATFGCAPEPSDTSINYGDNVTCQIETSGDAVIRISGQRISVLLI